MTTRERLHALIDELPDEVLGDAESTLESLQLSADDTSIDGEERVRRLDAALDAFAGAFDPAAHPEWATEAAIIAWCGEVRAGWARDAVS